VITNSRLQPGKPLKRKTPLKRSAKPIARKTPVKRVSEKRKKLLARYPFWKPKTKKRKREGNSEEHLAAIRKLPCLVTGKTPCGQVHHLKSNEAGKERGAGMRATDKWGVPLSFEAHILGVETRGSREEINWFKAQGVDNVHAVAKALWEASPDFDSMYRVILEHAPWGAQ
jgi:hypothetical protein